MITRSYNHQVPCVPLPPSLLPSAFRPGPAEYNLPTDSKPGVTLKFRHERTGKDTGPSPLDYADKDFRKIYMSGYTRKVGLDARFATKKIRVGQQTNT